MDCAILDHEHLCKTPKQNAPHCYHFDDIISEHVQADQNTGYLLLDRHVLLNHTFPNAFYVLHM